MRKYRLFIAAFMVAFFMSVPCYAGSQTASGTTGTIIVNNARAYLNEATASFWTAANMLIWLNEGTMDIVGRSHCLEVTEEKTLQIKTTNYPLTDSFIAIKNVVYKSYDEKVTNGTMEADSSWANTASAPATNARSTTQVYRGTYSRKFTPDAADEGIQGAVFTTVTGTTYYYSLFVYPDDATTVNVYIYNGAAAAAIVDTDVTGVTLDAWNVISGSYTSLAGGAGAYIAIRSITGVTSGDWYVDDVSVYSTGSSKSLRRGSIEHMADMNPTIGEPSYWTQWGNDVIVYPEPDSDAAGNVIEVYVIDRPADILVTAAPLVPAQYDRALTLYIVEQALIADEQYGKAAKIRADYLGEIDRYRRDFNTQPAPKDIR